MKRKVAKRPPKRKRTVGSLKRVVRGRPLYVYVVTYLYDYEGESLEAVYATKALAEKHPHGGDDKLIAKIRVKTKAP